MAFYRQESIEEVRNAVDIIDLVSEYVTLKKAGKNYVGLCPFHSEKTPSFTVNREKGIYHCFGCQAGGDVYHFLMEHEHLDFKEALESLAQRAGVELQEDTSGPQWEKPRDFSREKEINLEAARYFYRAFGQETGSRAVAYLIDRGVNGQTRKKFKLGYAPNSWDDLLKHFEAQGTLPRDVEGAGLAIRHEAKGTYYARFRDRLIFPIENVKGDIVGFGGRIMDQGEPKYLNSPESALFQKKDNLYGLNLALPEIRRTSRVLLMEGYMDVIISHQHGFTSAVASLGTALTVEQARLLAKHAQEVVIVYDNDAAGIKATGKAIREFAGLDLVVRVAHLQDANDPDEFIGKYGKESFEKVIKTALPAYEYLVRVGKKTHDLRQIEEKVQLIGALLPYLSDMHNLVEQTEYIKLTARELDLSEDSIAFELKKYLENQSVQVRREMDQERKKRLHKQQTPVQKGKVGNVVPGERQLLGICLRNPAVLNELKDELEALEPQDPLVGAVLTCMKNLGETGECFTFHEVLKTLENEEIRKAVLPLCLTDSGPDDGQTARDWLVAIRRNELRQEMDSLREKIELLEKEGKMDELLEIGKRLRTLQSELNRI